MEEEQTTSHVPLMPLLKTVYYLCIRNGVLFLVRVTLQKLSSPKGTGMSPNDIESDTETSEGHDTSDSDPTDEGEESQTLQSQVMSQVRSQMVQMMPQVAP